MGKPRIVDGGLATGLEELGHEMDDLLWSAGVFLEAPQAVEDLHLAYLNSGAEILITASYQMSYDGLARAGLDRGASETTMLDTIEAARRAEERSGKTATVAASIGPYGATLADGSEYRGHYGLSVAELTAFHRPRMELLAGGRADYLAIETIPSLEETEALAGLLAEDSRVRAWVSFSCRDEVHISDGQPIARAAAMLDGLEQVVAVGVNCTSPRYVSGLMDCIREASAKPIVLYPNSGETWDSARRGWAGDPAHEPFLGLARQWAAKGAWAIGGCCRVGPGMIRDLAALW